MPIRSAFVLSLLSTSLVFGLRPDASSINSPGGSIPADFSVVLEAPAVVLYRKNYQGGKPDFVQVVNLAQGASIESRLGKIDDPGKGQGPYGGDNPKIERQRLDTFWRNLTESNPQAFCITNGQFFSPDPNPTTLAFPVKIDGTIVSDGYGIDEFRDQKLMLELWADQADIKRFTPEAFKSSSAPDVIVGLTEDAEKRSEDYTGRTFVGVADPDAEGRHSLLLVFNTETARQRDAASVLRGFGAQKVMMLDGGSSTTLICEDTPYISTNARIPHAVGIVSGALPDLSLAVVQQPAWPVLIEGEALEIELVIRNTGSSTWRAREYQLVNLENPWGTREPIPLQKDVAQGQSVTFVWSTQAFSRWGVFSSEWHMARGSERFPGDPISVGVVVLPRGLEERREELEAKLQEWAEQQIREVEELILQWLEEQIEEQFANRCVPLAMLLPLVALVVMIVPMKSRRE